MEELGNFRRLKDEQDRVLKHNEEAQKTREKIKEDYLKLKTKLTTLPDVTTEDAMVPIGTVAFFPGHLIHTNELMVLLGDNWFVERSAKQSIEIIERRIKMVEKQVEDLQKEHTVISSQKSYTDDFLDVKQELGGIKEIQEELEEESSPRKKGSRTAHAAKHSSLPRSVKFAEANDLVESIAQDTCKANADTIDHKELLARLNQLEREEQEDEDRLHVENMKKIADGTYTAGTDSEILTYNDDMGATNNPERRNSKVKFKNDLRACKSQSYDSDDDPESSTITFTHTPHHQRERSASESDLRRTINSPADIFETFASKFLLDDKNDKPLKSILKKDSRSNSNENLKLRPILKTSPEHQPGTPELTFDDRRPILKTPPDSQGSDRRPGTPEYMLNEDEPKSILKNTNGDYGDVHYSPQQTSDDGDQNESRPTLKFLDVQFEEGNDCSNHTNNNCDETRSILKPVSERARSTMDTDIESYSSTSRSDRDSPSSILKGHEHDNRSSLFSSSKARNDSPEKKKTILKNTSDDAISDCVIERPMQSVSSEPTPKTSSSNKRPVSQFKASRSGR